MLKRCIYPVLFVFLFVFGLFILFYPPAIGLADNSDFARSIQGVKLDSTLKYFYFQDKFSYINETAKFNEHIDGILNQEDIPNEIVYRSTQSVFVKTAQVINSVFHFIVSGGVKYFDIRILGLLYLILYCAALIFLNKVIGSENRIITFILLAIIFMTDGYLLYFNSFFGEATILVSFLLYISAALYLIKLKSLPYWALVLYFASGMIFIGAKVANTPLGLLMALFTGLFFFYEKAIKKRIFLLIGICLFLFTTVYFYSKTPQWMRDVTQYHSIFYGVLKNSQSPSQDLSSLGIDQKYTVLANSNSYMDHHGYDIYSEEFREEVYEKADPLKVLFFYATHPGRFIEKMNLSAEASLSVRPTYLGNYTKTASTEILRFSNRFTLWENIRKSFTGSAFLVIGMVLFTFFSTIVYDFRRVIKKRVLKDEILALSFEIMLFGFAISQFILPVVGNGEADISKHMFLFNIIFDAIIVLLIMRLISWLRKTKLKRSVVIPTMVASVVLLVLSIVVFNGIRAGSIRTMTFGKYHNEPLVWELLEETEDYYFLVAKDLVDYRSFDSDNSNLWVDSDIRGWLNSPDKGGFLEQMSDEERERILARDMKSIVCPTFSEMSTTGNQTLFWSCIPGDATQNSREAYGIVQEEKVFLLSIAEWELYTFNKKKNNPYWLRTPYTNPQVVRIVGQDGYVYHKDATMKEVGVLPVLFLRK